MAAKLESRTIEPAAKISGCRERVAPLVWTALSAAVVPLAAAEDPVALPLALARLPELPVALAVAEDAGAEDDVELLKIISATVGCPSPWAFWYGVLRPSN